MNPSYLFKDKWLCLIKIDVKDQRDYVFDMSKSGQMDDNFKRDHLVEAKIISHLIIVSHQLKIENILNR